MEITEEDLELNSDEYDTYSYKRTINTIISEVNDVLFIHLEIGTSIWNIMKKINPIIMNQLKK